MFGVDSPSLMIGGLLAGIVFGVLLQRGQVARYAVIVGQFLFVDYTVIKIMFTAITVGAVGFYAMLSLGWIEGLLIKPAYLAGVGLGGLIFGVGMTGLGYCPGTCVAAVGAGSRHAIAGFLGGIVGAALYTEAYPVFEAGLLRVADLGKVSLPELLHVNPWALVVPLVAVALLVFFAIHRWERRQAPLEVR